MNVDVAILGAGTAGLGACREVEKAGKSFVLIEAGPYGTTCARVGCMPSKLLIAAADVAHGVATAETFGVLPGVVRVDGAAVMARVRRERDRFVAGVVRATEAIPESRRLHGRARFLGPTTLLIDGRQPLEAKTVVVATGSTPFVPPPFDALGDRVDTSDDVFEWTELPRSVAVIGTGAIGLELGQALARLRVDVTFLNPFDDVGIHHDDVMRAKARALFHEELDLHLHVSDVAAELVKSGVCLRYRQAGARHERVVDRVVVAAGRRAHLEALEIDKAGVTLDAKGRAKGWDPTTCRIGESSIFIAGDASGHAPLLHEASDEGHIAGANAARFPDVTPHDRRTPLTIAFTDPQMATVGARLADLDPTCTAIGEVSYADQGRARVMGQNRGLVRIYAQRPSCVVVGAELLGPRMEHMAQLLAQAVHARATVQDLLAMPFYHPVLEEGLRTALRDLAKALDVIDRCRGEDVADCPGQ